MISLATRHRAPELMDDPGLDPALHQQALVGLRRVHNISGTVSTLWNQIRRVAEQTPNKTLRILDVACGGGDLSISLARKAASSGLSIEFSGCDISQTALDFASSNAASHKVSVNFFQADVIAAPLPGDYDIICCSLFLHHLEETQVVKLLRSMKESARRMVLINDMVRSRWGYVLCWLGLSLLTRSPICHVDGLLSVRAAFTPAEMRNLAAQAELDDATLTCHWPERFLLTWRHS